MRAILYLLPVLLAFASAALAAGPTLTGTVLSTNKAPVPGATVFIFSAGPRVGTSSFCPTCYPDCRKSDVTDEKGAFTIEDLDPNPQN